MKKFLILMILANLSISVAKADDTEIFPLSTELHISRIKNLVDRAPKGICLTVGGERAFREASMFEGIEHLIIVDISPDIIKYDNINTQLLLAPNKVAYKHLRWESNFSEWKKISNTLTEEDFKWWNEYVRNMKGYDVPERLNRYGQANNYPKIRSKLMLIYPNVKKKFNNRESIFLANVSWSDIEQFLKNSKDPITKEEFEWFDQEKKKPGSCIQKFIDDNSLAVDWGQIIDYKAGNYLFDDKLYQRLHNLALKHNITAVQSDLTKSADIDSLIANMKKLQSKLAILDLDNLYLYEYMGEEKFRVALMKLLDSGTKDSIIILMSNYKDYPCAQFSIYVGFTFENVRHWPEGPFFDAFISSIPSEVVPLLDGRLYEGQDELPFYLMGKEPNNVNLR